MFVTRDEQNYETLSIYKYKCINNVIDYRYIEFSIWDIDVSSDEIDDEPQYYLIIETSSNEAFAHWIFECAIYLPLFHLLKMKFPNLQLHIQNNRTFKTLFCDYFKISEISNELKSNNICFFPLPISSLNHKTISEEFKNHVNEFSKYFNKIIHEKSIEILFMPRGSKENYHGNPRQHDTSDIENIFKTKKNVFILYTDNVNDIKNQIEIVNKSKMIFVPDGSAYLVNGMFAKNSVIKVLGNVVFGQANLYPKMRFLCDLIESNNNVEYLEYKHGDFNNSIFYYDDIKQYIYI